MAKHARALTGIGEFQLEMELDFFAKGMQGTVLIGYASDPNTCFLLVSNRNKYGSTHGH